MNTLTTALYAANSSLFVNSRDLDIISRNIANTDTPGYTRKVLSRSSLVFGGQGSAGVSADLLARNVPVELQRQYRYQTSVSTTLDKQATALSRIEVAFGDPSDESSIAALFGKVEDAFRQASVEPDDNLLHQQVIQTSIRFADELNQLSDVVQDQRVQAELSIQDSVQTINEHIADIAEYNDQIVNAKAKGVDTADLEDARDALVNDLSQELDISYYQAQDGRLIISTSDGKTLLDERQYQLRFTRSNITPQSFFDPTDPKAQLSNHLSGVYVDIPGGGPDVDITQSLQGGKLGAYFTLRDELLPQAQAQLDEFAANLLVRFGSVRDDTLNSDYQLFQDAGDTAAGIAPGSAFQYAEAAANGSAATSTTSYDFVAAGLGANQEVGLAARLQVNPLFINEQFRIREGTVYGAGITEGAPDPITGDLRFLATDSSLINTVISTVFDSTTVDLSGANFATPGVADFGYRISGVGANNLIATRLENKALPQDYGQSIVAFQANQLDDINNQLDQENYITSSVEDELGGISGVNIDQELSRLIEVEAAYSASGKVVTTIQSMLDDLLSII